jgi:hypothetical protein
VDESYLLPDAIDVAVGAWILWCLVNGDKFQPYGCRGAVVRLRVASYAIRHDRFNRDVIGFIARLYSFVDD